MCFLLRLINKTKIAKLNIGISNFKIVIKLVDLLNILLTEIKTDFTKKLSEMKAKVKETATFVCEMTEENVKPIWMKGGQKLTENNKYKMVTDKKTQKLIIHDITVEDKGEYTCIYRDTSTWAKLVVEGEFENSVKILT